MANRDSVTLEGYKQFEGDVKRLPPVVRKELRATFRKGAAGLTARAAGYASNLPTQSVSRATGRLGHRTSIKLGASRVTVTWTAPGAGVQEFAKSYTRGGPRPGQVVFPSATPRFAYRAWGELQPTFGEQFLHDFAYAVEHATGGYLKVV